MADYAPRYLLHTAAGSVKSDASNNTASTVANKNSKSSSSMSSAERDELFKLMAKGMSGSSHSSQEKDRLLQLMSKEIAHRQPSGKSRRKRFRLQIDDETVKTALRNATKTYYQTMSTQQSKCEDHETYISNKITAEGVLFQHKAATLSAYVTKKYGVETLPKPKIADDNVKAWGVVRRMQKRSSITPQSVLDRYANKKKFLAGPAFEGVVVILDAFYKQKHDALESHDAGQRKEKLKEALKTKKERMNDWRTVYGIAARPRRPPQATQVAFHLGENVMFTYDDIDDDYM